MTKLNLVLVEQQEIDGYKHEWRSWGDVDMSFASRGNYSHGVVLHKKGVDPSRSRDYLWLAWYRDENGHEPKDPYPKTEEEQQALVNLCKARFNV